MTQIRRLKVKLQGHGINPWISCPSNKINHLLLDYSNVTLSEFVCRTHNSVCKLKVKVTLKSHGILPVLQIAVWLILKSWLVKNRRGVIPYYMWTGITVWKTAQDLILSTHVVREGNMHSLVRAFTAGTQNVWESMSCSTLQACMYVKMTCFRILTTGGTVLYLWYQWDNVLLCSQQVKDWVYLYNILVADAWGCVEPTSVLHELVALKRNFSRNIFPPLHINCHLCQLQSSDNGVTFS